MPGSILSAEAGIPSLPPTQPANLLKQQDTWFGPDQAELAQADLGGASSPELSPPSLQVCGLQRQMAVVSPMAPTHTF